MTKTGGRINAGVAELGQMRRTEVRKRGTPVV